MIERNEADRATRHIWRIMWPYHPDLLARPVPRYTSYPTAAEFGPAVGAGDQAAAHDAIAPGTPRVTK